MAECLIPMLKLEPKIVLERPFELTEIEFEGELAEGNVLEIVVTAEERKPGYLFVAEKSDFNDILFQLTADLKEVQPRKEIFSGGVQKYRIRWKPDTESASAEDQKRGKLLRHVTVVASYRWKDRLVKSTIHQQIEISLDTSRIRRRLDSKLDSIMGLVPKELR